MPISLVLIDDHRIFIEGLRSLLSEENDFIIVHEFYSDQIPAEVLGFEEIDVILLDINLGSGNGIDLAMKIRQANPQAKILFFSMIQQHSIVLRALRSGAMGYILKNCHRTQLFEAIRSVHNNKTYLSPEISQIVVQEFLSKKSEILSIESVTPREREILQLIIDEFSNGEIAQKLGISPKTVEIHRMRLLSKFEVKNTAGLVRKAIEFNILSGSMI